MSFNSKGSSLIEVILGVGVFAIIAGGITILAVTALIGERQGGEYTEAQAYAQEGAEAVRSISEEEWNQIAFRDDANTYGLDNSSGQWEFSGTSNTNGKFTRTIDINDVERDGNGDIAVGTSDIETKEIVITTTWDFSGTQTNSIQSIFNLTSWNTAEWIEDTVAEFADGVFTNTIGTNNDDGEVELATTAGGGATYTNNWTFTTLTNYTYNPLEIEVLGGVASLVGTSSGTSTLDPGFDTGIPWAGNCWDLGSQETCTTSRPATGGNPDDFAQIALTARKNKEVGGYWEQSFVTTNSNPDIEIDLDYIVSSLSLGANDTATLYAYVDTASGAPTLGTEVWSQSIAATTGWTSATTFDDDDNVTIPGTYYLKVALWLDTGNAAGNPTRSVTGGFDNVQLTETSGGLLYPSTNPSIQANDSWDPDNKLLQWSSFTETATKNGGEIYYQLSSDDGSTWQYWDGATWSVAGASDYSTASTVNTNIGSFDTSTGQITFRAFLESDGSHDVELDDVQIQADIEEITMEVGTATTDENWLTVNTANTYTDPVVVATYKEHTATPNNDTYSVSARVRNAGTTSFDIRIEDPSGANLNPADISYIVMEQGDWVMGSTNVEAYKESIATVASNSSWVGDNKSYTHAYSAGPVVLHQVMSTNDTDWIESWVSQQGDKNDPPDTSGFQIAMNSAEVSASDTHGAETLGWIVFESGQNDTIDTTDFRTRVTGDDIRGHGNGCNTQSFGTTYTSPSVIGSQMAMDGSDGGWLVECSLSTTQVGYHVEEDTESDAERNHTTEQAGYVVFDGNVSVNGKAGSGYQTTGTYESSNFGTGSNFNFIKWSETLPANTDIQIQIKTAPDNSGSPGTFTATWSGPDGDDGDETDFFTDPNGGVIHPDHNTDEWIKYRVTLTGDGADTPTLNDITVNYKP